LNELTTHAVAGNDEVFELRISIPSPVVGHKSVKCLKRRQVRSVRILAGTAFSPLPILSDNLRPCSAQVITHIVALPHKQAVCSTRVSLVLTLVEAVVLRAGMSSKKSFVQKACQEHSQNEVLL
jgi:hypothetical protein